MTATVGTDRPAPVDEAVPWWQNVRLMMYAVPLIGILGLSIARIIADNDDLTSSGTFGTALRTAAPVALAGLAGLVAERSGTVNIGIEGMMTFGTIFAGWWGWEFGPWMAIVGGIVGGVTGGLIMSVATTTFGVNHIVAGVAINLLAPGVARFMASELFSDAQGGSVTSSPGNSGDIFEFTTPFIAGGRLFGWQTPNVSEWFEDQGWFLVSDIGGIVNGLLSELRGDVVITIALFFAIGYLLWRTPIGLRLRSAGERPAAADSLGVSVHGMRYLGMAISGGLAGMGGAVLVFSANRYQENQVAGRGFLGLATMIFGNWRPAGTAAGAGLFGYAQGVTQRTNPGDLVRALLLAATIGLLLFAVLMALRARWRVATWLGAVGLILLLAYLQTDDVNNQLVFVTPYLVMLIAVSVGAQRLRMPAEEGIPWFKGQQ
ncbi:MAG: ABC transporter permease [Actinomycetota bacterium]